MFLSTHGNKGSGKLFAKPEKTPGININPAVDWHVNWGKGARADTILRTVPIYYQNRSKPLKTRIFILVFYPDGAVVVKQKQTNYFNKTTQPISNLSNMKTNALKTTSNPLKLSLSAP